MSLEIEKKYLLKSMPNIGNISPINYERCFLHISSESEIRIQKKGDTYELERKCNIDALQADKSKIKISENEYHSLKKHCIKFLHRRSYKISGSPEITIKEYFGDFAGFSRVEVEFKNTHDANKFIPPEWFGKEITYSPLGRDSKLVQLSKSELLSFINS